MPSKMTNLKDEIAKDFFRKEILWPILFLTLSTVSYAQCFDVVSVQNGLWSDVATWNSGFVPIACDTVTIQVGHTVTVDITTATSGATTVNGTLSFSRSRDSGLTLVEGNLVVNSGGTLEMGTATVPIPNGIQAQLILAYGSPVGGWNASKYGLMINTGGNFTVHGAIKTPSAFANADALAGSTSVIVDGADIVGWAVGNEVTIGKTQRSAVDETERRTIVSLSGSNPLTIGFSEPLSYNHYATGPLIVSNLSRNVVVRSSGTIVSGSSNNSAYIQSSAQNSAGFNITYGEFAYIGMTEPYKGGIFLTVSAMSAFISSSTIRDSYIGIAAAGANQNTFTHNLIYKNQTQGILLNSSSVNTLTSNHVYSNASDGIWAVNAGNSSITSNTVYSNAGSGIFIQNSVNIAHTSNRSFSNAGAGIRLNWVTNSALTSNETHSNAAEGLLLENSASGNSISLHDSYLNANSGIIVRGSSNNILTTNISRSNVHNGIMLDSSSNNALTSNNFYSNSSYGIVLSGGANSNTLVSNNAYSNSVSGLYANSSSNNTIASNNFYSNANFGLAFDAGSTSNLLISNKSYSNAFYGIYFTGASNNNILIFHNSHSNSNTGVYLSGSSNNSIISGSIGYDSTGALLPDGGAEVKFDAAQSENLVLKNTRINPAVGISAAGFSRDGNYLLSYNQDDDTGTIRFHGDYTLSGSTWSLEHGTQLYASTATNPKLMRGSGHSASIVGTNDANALSQLVTIRYDGSAGNWRIEGSSTGFLGTFAASITGQPFPSGSPQFNLTFTQGANPGDGDSLDFALIAASRDQNFQKKFMFGSAAPGYRGGRSRLTISASGGFRMVGTALSPSLLDRLNASSTYYTFIDSGALTLAYSTITNTDESGLQLSGSADIILTSSTFDLAGQGSSSTSAYITARDLTSKATFYGLVFNNSRPNAYIHNMRVTGNDSELYWRIKNWSGPMAGEDYDDDPNERIRWGPFAPDPFAGSPQGISSITWSWPNVEQELGFRVVSETGANLSGDLVADTLSWTETGLSTNTTHTRRIVAFNEDGASSSIAKTIFTLALPPTNTSINSVGATTTTITWSANTNPSNTRYEVSQSTDNFGLSFSTPIAFDANLTSDSATISGLTPDATYYFRVRARNGDGILTAFSEITYIFLKRDLPLPPWDLTTTLVDGLKVRLDWKPSTSPGIFQYNLYWDNATGSVDYTVRLATVPSTTTTFITHDLLVGKTYRFGVRAQGSGGAEEKNTNVVVSITIPSPSQNIVRAAIKIPQSGRKVGGNRITVMAEIIQGDPGQVRQVEFQYRSAASTTTPWITLIAVNPNHPNPDTAPPYFTHWDVTGIAPGDYELRAVATDMSDNPDSSPPTVIVTVDNANPDTEEKVVGGVFQKREIVFNTISQTLQAGDPATNSITQVTLPAGAATLSSTTLKVVVNPAGTPSPSSDLNSCGQVREIILESGQTMLNNAATLIFQYQDSDNDGLVDSTLARVDKLAIRAYDPASGQWKKESASSVDTNKKTVTAQTSHFSLFGLFAPAAIDLSDVLVYPVPWVPNDGDTDNGKPYNSSDPSSGIVFDNITQSVKIQIYTITGELVWEKTTDTSSGKVQWDGKNDSGRNAASGGYFAVIADTATGSKVTRKIAVIR